MINTDEWTERLASSAKELARARVLRRALEQHYERVVSERASAEGAAAAELLVSGEAAEDMRALEDLLDEMCREHDEALFRRSIITTLRLRQDAPKEKEHNTADQTSA
jgi:16S rRNA G1207 methylase RsmC